MLADYPTARAEFLKGHKLAPILLNMIPIAGMQCLIECFDRHLPIRRSAKHLTGLVVPKQLAGSIRALLGADLEHTAEARAGWTAVLASYQDNVPGLIFKVPHHGSISSDFAEVWRKMLGENPIAVVTPFSGGRVRLTTDSDLTRLSNRTSRLYCTARAPGKPPAREPAVEKAVRWQVTQRRLVQGKPGHVRIRWSAIEKDANPIIEVFNGAFMST